MPLLGFPTEPRSTGRSAIEPFFSVQVGGPVACRFAIEVPLPGAHALIAVDVDYAGSFAISVTTE